MKKELSTETTIKFKINSFYLNGYSFRQHDPQNIATARIDVMYSLAYTDPDGIVTLSPLPEHREQSIAIYDIGENRRLSDFLHDSGADKSDLYNFSYRDIQRLVEADIKARFNFEE